MCVAKTYMNGNKEKESGKKIGWSIKSNSTITKDEQKQEYKYKGLVSLYLHSYTTEREMTGVEIDS